MAAAHRRESPTRAIAASLPIIGASTTASPAIAASLIARSGESTSLLTAAAGGRRDRACDRGRGHHRRLVEAVADEHDQRGDRGVGAHRTERADRGALLGIAGTCTGSREQHVLGVRACGRAERLQRGEAHALPVVGHVRDQDIDRVLAADLPECRDHQLGDARARIRELPAAARRPRCRRRRLRAFHTATCKSLHRVRGLDACDEVVLRHAERLCAHADRPAKRLRDRAPRLDLGRVRRLPAAYDHCARDRRKRRARQLPSGQRCHGHSVRNERCQVTVYFQQARGTFRRLCRIAGTSSGPGVSIRSACATGPT